MRPKKFHIWQFPEDKIRILFRNHKRFIDNAIKFFGSKKDLANFLGVSPAILSDWKKLNLYIPLWAIKKLVDKLSLNWLKLEKDILAYKGVNTSLPIKNPILPIKETPEIFALITHIICDGCVNKNGIPYYINSNKYLINNLNNILHNNFGDMNTKLYFGRGINKNCYEYRFPKIITELLEYFYDIKLYRAERLPKEIFNLPKEFSISVIKAFGDDEGHVDLGKRIAFYSTSKVLLEQLVKLLREKLFFENLTNIREKEEGYYYFYLNQKDIDKYEKEIGFNHPNKSKRLKKLVELKQKGRGRGQHTKVGETKEKLLKLLSDKRLSTYEIMGELQINKSNVNSQTKRLYKENLIVQDNKVGNTIFWTRRK